MHQTAAKWLQIYIFDNRLLSGMLPKTTLCKGIKFKKEDYLDPKASQIDNKEIKQEKDNT